MTDESKGAAVDREDMERMTEQLLNALRAAWENDNDAQGAIIEDAPWREEAFVVQLHNMKLRDVVTQETRDQLALTVTSPAGSTAGFHVVDQTLEILRHYQYAYVHAIWKHNNLGANPAEPIEAVAMMAAINNAKALARATDKLTKRLLYLNLYALAGAFVDVPVREIATVVLGLESAKRKGEQSKDENANVKGNDIPDVPMQ